MHSENVLGVGFATKALSFDEFVGQGQMSFGYGSNGTFWNSNRFVHNMQHKFSRNDIVGWHVHFVCCELAQKSLPLRDLILTR
uniref:Fibrinogen C-terminal domain-containing protein n=1 Tax=Globodera pallida TaxID=36090 RepID=A0A183CLB1_GLOPA